MHKVSKTAFGASVRTGVAPSRMIAVAAMGAALALGAVALVHPIVGAQALLTASIVATVVASVAGLLAAARGGADDRSQSDAAPGLSDDVLERIKDARWRLADDEARFRRLLDTQDDLIERRLADGRIAFVNRAYCKAFRVAFEDVVETRFFPPMLAAEQQRAPVGERARVVELIDTADGPRWISWEEQRIDAADSGVETQRVGHDVTNDRRLTAELSEARDQAQGANRAKSRFLASMSHEIRTPMNGILGMTSLLADTDLTEMQRAYARAVDESARALLTLIDEILDFSKIEAGHLALSSEAFSLRACIGRAVELLGPRAESKGLSLTWSIEPGAPDGVVGDETRVRQILLNLLSNAVKFTDAGCVTVRVYPIGQSAQADDLVRFGIEVADTGVGFSAEAMRRLFDEFDQGDAATERRRGGAGLGLAISKRLARAMGGDITADGAPGKGATFKVMLRLPPAAASLSGFVDRHTRQIPPPLLPAAMSPDRDSRPVSLQAVRVLIAEDNAINALLARRIVERLGGEATVVADGAAAVAAMTRALHGATPRFDLILMDMFMPVMDGLEASRAIAALFADGASDGAAAPPIIALTANAYPEDRARCFAAGMSDYLAKPFDKAQLQDIVGRWLQPVR